MRSMNEIFAGCTLPHHTNHVGSCMYCLTTAVINLMQEIEKLEQQITELQPQPIGYMVKRADGVTYGPFETHKEAMTWLGSGTGKELITIPVRKKRGMMSEFQGFTVHSHELVHEWKMTKEVFDAMYYRPIELLAMDWPGHVITEMHDDSRMIVIFKVWKQVDTEETQYAPS